MTARVYTLAIHILIRSTYDIFTPIMKKPAFRLVRGFALLSGFLLLISGTVMAQNCDEAMQFKGGTWQTIVDGKSGEGFFFYRLSFE